MGTHLLDPAEFRKFVKIAGLLESDNPHERAVAAERGTRLLKANKLCWADVLRLPEPECQHKPSPPSQPDWKLTVQRLLIRWEELTDWERTFCTNIFAFRTLSPKQLACLAKIERRVLGDGR
jgi:hypothetical protein